MPVIPFPFRDGVTIISDKSAMAKNPPPRLKFLVADPAHLVACGFGSGLSTFAPGTVGTAFAWASYPLLRFAFPGDLVCLAALAVMFAFGVYACQVTGRHLGVVDHGAIVWDEIVPFWGILMFCPPLLLASPHGTYFSWNGLLWQTAAFFLFRLFDIIKLPPAGYFDRQVKNGFGVMMDDVMAAGHTILVLAVLKHLLG